MLARLESTSVWRRSRRLYTPADIARDLDYLARTCLCTAPKLVFYKTVFQAVLSAIEVVGQTTLDLAGLVVAIRIASKGQLTADEIEYLLHIYAAASGPVTFDLSAFCAVATLAERLGQRAQLLR